MISERSEPSPFCCFIAPLPLVHSIRSTNACSLEISGRSPFSTSESQQQADKDSQPCRCVFVFRPPTMARDSLSNPTQPRVPTKTTQLLLAWIFINFNFLGNQVGFSTKPANNKQLCAGGSTATKKRPEIPWVLWCEACAPWTWRPPGTSPSSRGPRATPPTWPTIPTSTTARSASEKSPALRCVGGCLTLVRR